MVYVVLWYIEMQNKIQDNTGLILQVPWIESTLIILGYGAIIVNAVFLLLYLIVFSFKKEIKIPRWIIIFNLILLGFQIYFHFIFK